MGILGSIFNAVMDNLDKNADRYDSGYSSGSYRASNMSDDELRDSLKRKANNGVSDWKSAGEFKAMANEYKRRKGK